MAEEAHRVVRHRGPHIFLTIASQGHSAAGRIRSIEDGNDFIGKRTRDLTACSKAPKPTVIPSVSVLLV
jgi:hypothetical protein